MVNLWALPCIISPCKDRRPELSECSMNTASCMVHMYYTGGSKGLGMSPLYPLSVSLGGTRERGYPQCVVTRMYCIFRFSALQVCGAEHNTRTPRYLQVCVYMLLVFQAVCEVYDLTLQHTGAQSDHRGQEDNKKRFTL